MKKFLVTCMTALALWGCGGGGGGGVPVSPPVAVDPPVVTPPVVTPPVVTPPVVVPPDPPLIEPDKFPSAASMANVCTPDGQKTWIRAHLNEVYLWYKEIVDVPPASYSNPLDYFAALLVKSKDRFSFTQDQATSDSYFAEGTEFGYGWNLLNVSGRLMITHVDAGTPAQDGGLARGAQITGINGTPIGQLSREVQLAALYPTAAGQRNNFDILDNGAAAPHTVTLQSALVDIDAVPVARILTGDNQRKIGYLAFTDHIATSETPLINAVRTFQTAGVQDVVLDVRYNGGGYVYVADILASMLGGTKVSGKAFEKLEYNDKRRQLNSSFPFYETGVRVPGALPRLNLPRVFVLTTSRTCSASELIINGLKPFMDVITIGGATCGKPYGMSQTNNCGTAFYAIQFAGVNDKGEGNFQNGFAPVCSIADDLTHPLGDPAERMLAGALGYAATGACPAAKVSQASLRPVPPEQVATEPLRSPLRDNAFVK